MRQIAPFRRSRRSVQRVGELAPARDDLGVGGVEQVEQLDQPGADLGALVAGGALDQRDQPVERRRDVLLQDLDIGRGERGLDVVGRGVGRATIASGGRADARAAGSRSGAPRPWPRRDSGWRRGSPGTRVSAASKSPASRCARACASSGSTCSGSSASPAPPSLPAVAFSSESTQPPQLLGRLHALEARQRLARGQRHHGRDGLHAEHLRHPRHRCRRSRSPATTCRRRRPRGSARASPSWTLASLRGDHSSTTTGTWLDRTSTSASKLASVISTPPGGPEPAAAPSLGGCARCLRAGQVNRTGHGGRDGRTGTSHAPKSVTSFRVRDRPGCRTPADALAAPIRPVRSAHMRKITLHSGTMLASNASNHVPARPLEARFRRADRPPRRR